MRNFHPELLWRNALDSASKAKTPRSTPTSCMPSPVSRTPRPHPEHPGEFDRAPRDEFPHRLHSRSRDKPARESQYRLALRGRVPRDEVGRCPPEDDRLKSTRPRLVQYVVAACI